MALNDDAVIDLDDTLVDHDVIQSSPVASVSQQQTTVIPWSPEVSPQSQALTDTAIQAIAQSDVNFKILTDNVEHIVELEDIEKEFIAQESICQSTAKYINEHFSGLLNHRVTLESFTKLPSQVNHSLTKRYIRQTIVQEQLTLTSSFMQFTESSIKDTVNLIIAIDENYLRSFIDNMSSMAETATGVIGSLSENKNTIVPFQNGECIEFIDIAEADLLTLDFQQLKLESSTVTQLSLYRDNIKHILSDSDMRLLVTLVVDCNKVSYPADKEILARSVDRPIHLLLLAKLFNSVALREYLETFELMLSEYRRVLDDVQTDATAMDNFDKLKQFMIERSSTVHTAIKNTLRIVQCMNHLNLLAYNMKEMFLYMDKISHPKA